jgi:hypothetical protein
MKDFYKYLNINSYSSIEWKLMKISFSLIWMMSFLLILFRYNYAPTPESILKLFPDGFYLSIYVKIILFFCTILFIYLYVSEQNIWWALLGLSLISLFAFSLEDSNSDFNRNTMITSIFFAQFFAYTIKKKYFVLVRPVIIYEIADGINLATLFPQDPLRERDNLELRVVNYILYGNGKVIILMDIILNLTIFISFY